MTTKGPNMVNPDAGLIPCIITGGSNKSQPPEENNTCQALIPGLHGPNVIAKNKEMPFFTRLGGSSQSDIEKNSPPPETGTAGYLISTTGCPSDRIFVGAPAEQQTNPGGISGNIDLTSMFSQFFQEKTNKIKSEGFETSSRNGAEIRKPKDGEEWYNDLTRGLPIHAALYPLSGTILPAVKKIETAKQQFSGILNSDMLSQLPGQLGSLSSIFKGMSSSQKSKAKQNMSPDIANGFESMINLTQSPDTSSTFAVDGRANIDYMIEQTVELFSQCRSLEDLMACMHRLQYDSSLRGLDTLPKVNIKSDSGFGEFSFELDAEGNLTFDDIDSNTQNVTVSTMSDLFYANTANIQPKSTTSSQKTSGGNSDVLNKIQSFASKLASGAQNAGISPKENLFKDQAQKVAELIGRVPADTQKSMVGDMEKAMGPFHKKITQAVKTVVPFGIVSNYFT